MEEGDFTEQAGEIGGGSSGGSNNQSESNDPAKEKPTDETIKVKITDISYNFVKKDRRKRNKQNCDICKSI